MGTIFELNDDCLRNVICFLDLQSQISFAEACARFEQVFLQYAKIEYRRIGNKSLEGLSKSETRKFLEFVGVNIISWNGFFATHLLLQIAEYCTNLKVIALDYSDTWPSEYFSCITRLQFLQSIDIYASNRRCSTLNRFILTLRGLPNLRRLAINAFDYLGENLAELKQLHTLEVCNSAPLRPISIVEFCIAMSNLRCLRLQRQTGQYINTQVISKMLHHCVNLEELSLPIINNTTTNYEMLADLPKLKYLELFGADIPSEIFVALAEHKSKQLLCLQIVMHKISTADAVLIAQMSALRELQCWYRMERSIINIFAKLKFLEILNFRYSNIDNAHLLLLFDTCRNLRFVDLYSCRRISTAVVQPLLKLLDLYRSHYTKPVELCVKGTQIEGQALLASDYFNGHHLLKLHFEQITNYSLMKTAIQMKMTR